VPARVFGCEFFRGRRQAKVGDAYVAATVEHYIGRQLMRHLQRLILWQPPDALQQRTQVFAVHELHRDEGHAVGFAQVEYAADVATPAALGAPHVASALRPQNFW
jgi:hypothetical protein